jgi:ATPase family AAA domain-containing protein 3A/B
MTNRNLSDAQREQARQDYNRVLGEKQEQIRQINNWAAEMAKRGANTLQDFADNSLKLVTNKLQAQIDTARAVAVERERGNSLVRTAQASLDWFGKNPHVVIGTAAGIFASYFILKHGSKYVADRWSLPALAQETSLLSPMQRVSNWALGIKPDSDLSAVKFSPEMSLRMARSARGLKNMVANGSLLLNKLFYGPPGTGKTEYAKRLARDSGMEYVYFSAALVEQFSIEEATRQIKELFDKARRSDKPYMIVADEAEICLADREKMFSGGSTPLNDKRYAIANIFLTELGDGSPHYMCVAITNFEEELDRAFINRCGEEIEFFPPEAPVRREILDHFLDKILIRGEHLSQKENVSGWRKFLSFVIPKEQKKVTLAKDVLSATARAGMSARLDGWVGRDIKNFVVLIEQYARATDACMVTPEVIEEALSDAIRKKEKDDERYRQQVASRRARLQ